MNPLINIKPFILILLIVCSQGLFSCKSSRTTKVKVKTRSSKSTYKEKVKTPTDANKAERNSTDPVDKVLSTARSYTGTKYKYGGSTRSGIDCSGLVCAAFKSADIMLPRTSAEQSLKGKKISISEIQKGDLLFFTDRKGRKKVTHVGIVTEVKSKDNIKFIHSSTKLGVVEDNLYAEYYIKLFVKAMRVF